MSNHADLDRQQWIGPLRELIRCEKEDQNKYATALKYRPLSEKAMGLNFAIPSVEGPVDMDWMMCLALFSRWESTSWLMYSVAKRFWNATDPRRNSGWEIAWSILSPHTRLLFQKRFRQMLNSGLASPEHLNAQRMAHRWMSTDVTLENLFAPALYYSEKAGMCMAP